jgi:hypothetical protein
MEVFPICISASGDSPVLFRLPKTHREYHDLKALYCASTRLDTAGPWLDRLYKALNPKRFAHSLSVARTSVRLAEKYRAVDVNH